MSADYAAHDGHGVGVAAETFEEAAQLFVHHGVVFIIVKNSVFAAALGSSPLSSK